MVLTDTIADMLTTIRNGLSVQKEKVLTPFSKVKLINPNFTASEYRRHVYVTSQSWWRPTSTATPASAACSWRGTPSFSKSRSIAGSTSSKLAGRFFGLAK